MEGLPPNARDDFTYYYHCTSVHTLTWRFRKETIRRTRGFLKWAGQWFFFFFFLPSPRTIKIQRFFLIFFSRGRIIIFIASMVRTRFDRRFDRVGGQQRREKKKECRLGLRTQLKSSEKQVIVRVRARFLLWTWRPETPKIFSVPRRVQYLASRTTPPAPKSELMFPGRVIFRLRGSVRNFNASASRIVLFFPREIPTELRTPFLRQQYNY